MKKVLISIKPYWLFLIIAKTMGWKTDKEKTVEVRKSYPKNKDWNKTVILYCTKDKTSFNQIPKEYQPIMERFLGKIAGVFVCDKMYQFIQAGAGIMFADENYNLLTPQTARKMTCLDDKKIDDYLGEKDGYGWHISDLKIYDKPKGLLEFIKPCENDLYCEECAMFRNFEDKCGNSALQIKRPPQSWCYVEV